MVIPISWKRTMLGLFALATSSCRPSDAWCSLAVTNKLASLISTNHRALSSDFLDNDLVAVQQDENSLPRLCVVRDDATVAPLCQHEDDVETDLYIHPQCYEEKFWEEASDENVRGTYGEGWYGQRPVPSLGGGPGYGADAHEIWSIDEDLLSKLADDGVELPILDVGIAHGEQARGGAF